MSYLDTTLTPAAGYTYVNFKQVYDAIVAQLTAHAGWTFIETVDFISGANTIRSSVWRNDHATSGLSADWFVIFTYQFVTATGVFETTPTGGGLRVSMCELYNSTTHVASKPAPMMSATSFTLASDRSHPATWTLTAARPSAIAYGFIGPTANTTSWRMLLGVTNDVIYSCGDAPSQTVQTYVGAMESLLSSADDPFPLLLGCSYLAKSSFNISGSSYHFFSGTRHPKLTPGSMTYAFGFTPYYYHAASGSAGFGQGGFSRAASDSSAGVLGDPTNVNYSMFLGGALVSKCSISSSGANNTGSTRGGLRGFLKYMRAAQLATHSMGDTFDIGGVAYAGMGASLQGLWNTTA